MSRIAVFLSCDSFEKFFGGNFGLDRTAFVDAYRNDFAWSYGEALVKRGHTVTLYILSYGPGELRQTASGLQVRFVPMPAWLRVADSLLYRLEGLPNGALRRERVRFAAYRGALERAFAEDRIEVLYNQELWTARFPLLLQNIRLPIIGADHGAVDETSLDGRRRVVFPRADRVICQTAGNLERARSLGARTVMIPNGVDPDFFCPADDRATRPKILLAVGRLTEPQKRFSDLLAALALLPDYSLILVGTGPDENLLRQRAQELQVADRVDFRGFVSDRSELRRLYRECGVFVSSSAWEAMALVMLEAMSCGTPVVGTRIPSFEALLEGEAGGLLVPIGDPAAMAEAIVHAHTRASELGAAARARVLASYDAEVLFDQLDEIIKEAAQRAAGQIVESGRPGSLKQLAEP